MRTVNRASFAVIGSAAVAVLSVAPATAAETSVRVGDPRLTKVTKIEVPMVITGFDPKVAAAHGFPTTPARGSIGGKCGSSFVYIYNGNKDPYTGINYGGRGYGYNTGFTIAGSPVAIEFEWTVRVSGPGWSKTDYDPGHAMSSHYWTGHNHWATPNAGSYTANVQPQAYAILNTGGYCTSLYPSDPVSVT